MSDTGQRKAWKDAIGFLCPSESEWLDWVEGRVDEERHEMMKRHRAGCDACQHVVEDALLFTGTPEEKAKEWTAEGVEAVMRSLPDKAQIRPKPPDSPGFESGVRHMPKPRPYWAMAAAALMTVSVGTGYWAWQRDERQTQEIASLRARVEAAGRQVAVASPALPDVFPTLTVDLRFGAVRSGEGPSTAATRTGLLPATQGLMLFLNGEFDESVTGTILDAQGVVILRDLRFRAQKAGMGVTIAPGKLHSGSFELRLSSGKTTRFAIP